MLPRPIDLGRWGVQFQGVGLRDDRIGMLRGAWGQNPGNLVWLRRGVWIGASLAALTGPRLLVKPKPRHHTVIADEEYLRTSMESPAQQIVKGFAPIMPTYRGIMKEEDLNAVVAYIKSLKE